MYLVKVLVVNLCYALKTFVVCHIALPKLFLFTHISRVHDLFVTYLI